MNPLTAAAVVLALATLPPAQFVREPRTGVTFAARVGEMSLLGVGVRTKSILKIKVYAIGLYVADSAISGPLAIHDGKVGTPAFYDDLVTGDFEKQIVLKLVRDLSAEQIQGAFRSHMLSVDRTLLNQFVSYFEGTKAGQECVLRWVPGGILETSVGGIAKPAIPDKAFTQACSPSVWGTSPHHDPIRRRLVSRRAR